MKKFLLLLSIISSGFVALKAQPIAVPIPSDSTSKLEILPGSGRYTYNKIDSINTIVSLAARARIRQDKTLIEADSAVINLYTKIMEAFGNVHINDSDTLNTYSQYVKYFGKERKAHLTKSVRLTDNKGGVLLTDDLEYDMVTRVATYSKGGKVLNKTTVLTSQEGTYFGDSRDVIFRKDVVLIDPEYKLVADSLLYNTATEIARFICPTTIVAKGGRRIYTKDGFYNLRTGEAYFGERATIKDSTQTITSDRMAIDDKTGMAQFEGNVNYTDSVQKVKILAGKMNVDKKNGTFLATQHPVMIIKQDDDSLYVTGDTLYSGRLTQRMKIKNIPVIVDTSKVPMAIVDLEGKDSTKNRFFEAFHNVKIFSDSMQAVCDSMFYSSVDSAFRLYTKPVLWANNSQITGDTIYLFTKNKKAEQLYAYENGFIINRIRPNFYNQVKGRTVNALFLDGNIDYVRTKGNAESVYYAQDEQEKFVGMNKATADAIDMFFKDKAANRVVFRKDLKGTTYPIRGISLVDTKLAGFNWQDDKRPKTKFDLFVN